MSDPERLTLEEIEKEIYRVEYIFPESCKRMVICVVTTHNGFSVAGMAIAATEANFEESIGKEWSRKKALDQLWEPMLYARREAAAARNP